MKKFIFESYNFDKEKLLASFSYRFDDGRSFTETVSFNGDGKYNEELLNKALFLTFILIGTSYYKTFPTRDVMVNGQIDEWQANFFNKVYQEGLGQFALENELRRDDLAHFVATSPIPERPISYDGSGVLALQSGGKDSLLTAVMLQKSGIDFTAWYASSSDVYPEVLNSIGSKLAISVRSIDHDGLRQAASDGAKNGHVPITYIMQSLALIQAILLGKKYILTSIAHEGEEPHSYIGDLAVNHQWSKTWAAEQAFAEYVHKYISPDIFIGSLLRKYSELRVAELFVENSWGKYGHIFSSCNIFNYKQGNDNRELNWCGECPKCANSYLLFAPFLSSHDLKSIFNNKDLFADVSLEFTFKGLLGIDSVKKPFECVGETDELRLAYHMAMKKGGYELLPFIVPAASFDYKQTYPAQDWAEKMLQ